MPTMPSSPSSDISLFDIYRTDANFFSSPRYLSNSISVIFSLLQRDKQKLRKYLSCAVLRLSYLYWCRIAASEGNFASMACPIIVFTPSRTASVPISDKSRCIFCVFNTVPDTRGSVEIKKAAGIPFFLRIGHAYVYCSFKPSSKVIRHIFPGSRLLFSTRWKISSKDTNLKCLERRSICLLKSLVETGYIPAEGNFSLGLT